MIGRDPVYASREKLLLNCLGNLIGKILDIGCSRGDASFKLKKRGVSVIGIDNDREILKLARKKFPEIKFVYHNLANKLPFQSNYFDVIWAGDIIEHVVDTRFFLKEINRVLKKKGILILSTPYHGLIKNFVIALYNFDKHYHPEGDHLHFYTKQTLRGQLVRNGFIIKKLYLLGRIRPLAKSMFVVAKKQ